ncbi:flavodoxin family protein [Desulfatitalea tepidiphila]|uniref:flavodoxin family protein n=1 Tax=Desulfatitalea tepidiphila TaxID=1185843 RepID=UPI0006B58510|nr:flavodoxin family protein [Desulfatitalea tepidiphila]
MKILGLVCSPRKAGNTEILVEAALSGAREKGAQTEWVCVADKQISPCDACGACAVDGICVIEDDMQEIYQKLELADGIIFGTPVYFLNVSAQAKAVMDRTYACYRTGKLRGKVAGAAVAVRRVGAGQVLSLLYSWFTAQRMITVGGCIGYGLEKGDVREGTGGGPGSTALGEAKSLGKAMVGMVHRIAH